MKVSLIQTDISWNNSSESLAGCAALSDRALSQGGQLLVFPEMFPCGFSMPTGEQARGFEQEGKAFLESTAASRGAYLIGSLPEVSADGKLFNTAWAVGPSGVIGSYRKIHLFSYGDETQRYSGGSNLFTASLGDLRCSIFICYDLRFAAPFQALAHKTDIFIVVANWPSSRREHWLTLLRARAIECQCYVAGVNRVGNGGGLSYSGDSALFAPDGSQIALLGNEQDVVTAEVSPDVVASWREAFPALRDRQLALYSKW